MSRSGAAGAAGGDRLRRACRRRLSGSAEPVALSAALAPGDRDRLLAELEAEVTAAGGLLLSADCRAAPHRPLAGPADLAEQLALRLELDRDPPGPGLSPLLERSRWLLEPLLPAGRIAPAEGIADGFRPGLRDYVFRGDLDGLADFYWRRDERPRVTAGLIRFLLDAAGDAAEPGLCVLCLEGFESADEWSAEVWRQAAVSGRGLPVLWLALGSGGELPAPVPADAVLDPASLLVHPFRPEHLRALAGDGAELAPEVDRRVAERRLRELAGGWLVIASGDERQARRRRLSRRDRRRLHDAALELEAGDPFAALWHEREGTRGEQVPAHARSALERAWRIGDLDLALDLEPALRADGGVEVDLLRGLLCYEAGRFDEAETSLRRAREARRRAGGDWATVERMIGYNAIFGRGDCAGGRAVLEPLVTVYERQGRGEQALFLRNNIAYAQVRSGDAEGARENEERALALLGEGGQGGGLLAGVLQLNLGRLERSRSSDRALERIRAGAGEEMSSPLRLIFLTALAQVHRLRGEAGASLAALEECLDLCRDADLDAVGYPVLDSLERLAGITRPADLTRGDLVSFLLAAALARLAGEAGLEDRSRAYRRGLRRLWRLPAGAGAPGDGGGTSGAPPAWPDFARQAEAATAAGRCVPEGVPAELLGRLAELLAAGRSVAVVRPRPEAGRVDCCVLFDPRRDDLAGRLAADLGGRGSYLPAASAAHPPRAAAALALRAAAELFRPALETAPLLLQERVLRRSARAELRALEPRVRVQLLSARLDGFLAATLERFATATGLPMLAAVPFHLRRRPLAVTPSAAVAAFLLSPVDRLLLGDRLLAKPSGGEELSVLRPRLSRHARLREADEGTVVELRVGRFRSRVRVGGGGAWLARLDGRRTAEELLEEIDGDGPGRRRHLALLGELRRRGIVDFAPEIA